MDYALSAAWVFAEYFSFVMLADAFLQRRFIHPALFWACILGCAAFCYGVTGLLPVQTSLLKTCLFFVFFSPVSFFLYLGSMKRKLFAMVLLYILIYGLDYVAIAVIMGITHTAFNAITQNFVVYILATFLSKTLLVCICYVIRRAYTARLQNVSVSFWEWSKIAIIPALSLLNLIVTIDGVLKAGLVSNWLLADAFLTLAANIAVLPLWDKIAQEQQLLLENNLLQRELSSNLKAAQAMARNYDQQRRVTHDYRNHLQTLAGLLQQGEHSQAQAYLKKLIGQSPQAAYVLDTQNPVFDSLLNQKYQQACGQNIGMEFNLEGINELPFSNEDLVTLFSNLLDNAIEACEKVKGRRVVIVTLRCTGTETLLTVRNTSPPVDTALPQLSSTKKDAAAHGYGLKNVCAVLEKYNSEFAFHYNDGWFNFSALLKGGS